MLHRAGYAAAGLAGWQYDAHEVDAAGLAGFVAGLGEEWRGLSLTMPLKEVAAEVATTVDEVARRAGAVNTLVRRDDGGWDATNTDVVGVVRALAPHLPEGARRALVLGAGATARSAVLALAELGVTHAHRAGPRHRPGRRPAGVGARPGLPASATARSPRWARGSPRATTWSSRPLPGSAGDVAAAGVPASHAGVLLDVVYAGWPTPLAAAASAAGMTVVSGLDMLVHQAAEQFRLFTGQRGPGRGDGRRGRARPWRRS